MCSCSFLNSLGVASEGFGGCTRAAARPYVGELRRKTGARPLHFLRMRKHDCRCSLLACPRAAPTSLCPLRSRTGPALRRPRRTHRPLPRSPDNITGISSARERDSTLCIPFFCFPLHNLHLELLNTVLKYCHDNSHVEDSSVRVTPESSTFPWLHLPVRKDSSV